MPECIQEICRAPSTLKTHIWHLASGPANKEATWRPIRCGGGISFPGNSQDREPTCSECTALASREEKAS